jgi:hypothetical protein
LLSATAAAAPATPAAAITFLLEFALAEAEDLKAFAKAVPTGTSYNRDCITQGKCSTCGQRLPSLLSPQLLQQHHPDMLTPVSSSKPLGAAPSHSRRSTGEVLQQLQESKERAAAMSAATAALNGIATATHTALTPRRMSMPGATASSYLPALLSARGTSMSPRPSPMSVPGLQSKMAAVTMISSSSQHVSNTSESRPAEPSFRAQLAQGAEECPTPKLSFGPRSSLGSGPMAAAKLVPKLALPGRLSSDLVDVRDQAYRA